MIALAQSIQRNIPDVQVITWYWGQYLQAYRYLRTLPPGMKRVLVGYSGGGSRSTYIANQKPRQSIDLIIGYPSPTWQMMPLTPNIERAICYHNNCPNFGGLGGGRFTGIKNIQTIEICENHLDVQWDQSLHRRTIRAIAELRPQRISEGTLKKLLADTSLESLNSISPKGHFIDLQTFTNIPTPHPVGSPKPFSTNRSTSHNENGFSTTEGLNGTEQKYDNGSTVIEATEALSAYRKDPRMSGTLTAFCRRVEKDNMITVQQGNYSYNGRQLAVSSLFLDVDDIPITFPVGFDGTAVRTVKATRFGKNDREDEGTGSPDMGLVQTNSEVFGGSVKVSVMKKIFGQRWNKNDKRLSAMIEVFYAHKGRRGRMVRVPLVDVGPGEKAKSRAEVDLTWACDQHLGTQGEATVKYRILLPSQKAARGFGSKVVSKKRRRAPSRRVRR
jgi:hypothetical protein